MIGTIYERLDAITTALIAEQIEPRSITITAHPETMREFAICFTPELSAKEITFDATHKMVGGLELTENELAAIGVSEEIVQRAGGMSAMRWRGMLVVDEPMIGKGGVLVQVDNQRAVLIKLDALPALDHMIPKALDGSEVTAKAKRALARISPRRHHEPD